MKENSKSNYLSGLFFLFLIIFFIKYFIFKNIQYNNDQAFYSQWLADMRAAQHLFPVGPGSFIQNLLLDQSSFLHQLFKRIYNNFSVIFNIFPLFLNYLFGFFFTKTPFNFNLISIIANTCIPFFFLIILKDKLNNINLKYFLFYILLILLISFNFSFFYYSPLGFHNFGILFLIFTIFFSQKNLYREYFFDKNFIIFGILIPITCHSYNFFFIITYLFTLIIYRKVFLSTTFFNRDILIFFSVILIFAITLLTLLIINHNNIFFIKGILNLLFNETSFSFLEFMKKLFINTQIWLMRIIHYFGIFNLIIFLIFVYKFKNPTLLIAIFINYLLFIFLNLDGHYPSIILYNLIPFYFYFFFYIKKFDLNFKKNYFDIFIISTLLLGLSFNIYKINYKINLNTSELEFYNFYYKDNKTIKNNLLQVVNKVKNEQVIFNKELSKNIYYSNYYSLNNIKHVITNDFIIDGYYNKFFKKDQFTKAFVYDYNSRQKQNLILENTYYLYFGHISEDPLKKICIIFKDNDYDCKKIKKVDLNDFKEKLEFMNLKYKMVLYYLD